METKYVLISTKRMGTDLSFNAIHIFDSEIVGNPFTAVQFIYPATGMLLFEADAACKELVKAGLAKTV